MYYTKKEIEEIRKTGEKIAKDIQEKPAGKSYESQAGLLIKCMHCQNDSFWKNSTILDSRLLALFNFSWLAENANILICTKCGYIHWFRMEVKEVIR